MVNRSAVRGWVYVITNKSMPSLAKIGFSLKDPSLRAREFDATALPHRYVVAYEVLVENPYQIEQEVHKRMSERRENKEWFSCDVGTAVSEIRATIGAGAILENCNYEEDEQEDYRPSPPAPTPSERFLSHFSRVRWGESPADGIKLSISEFEELKENELRTCELSTQVVHYLMKAGVWRLGDLLLLSSEKIRSSFDGHQPFLDHALLLQTLLYRLSETNESKLGRLTTTQRDTVKTIASSGRLSRYTGPNMTVTDAELTTVLNELEGLGWICEDRGNMRAFKKNGTGPAFYTRAEVVKFRDEAIAALNTKN